MSAVMKPRRHPQTIRDAAIARFKEMAMPLAVSKELGLPYRSVYQWYREHIGRPIPRKAKPPREYAREMALSSDSDPGDQQEDGC